MSIIEFKQVCSMCKKETEEFFDSTVEIKSTSDSKLIYCYTSEIYFLVNEIYFVKTKNTTLDMRRNQMWTLLRNNQDKVFEDQELFKQLNDLASRVFSESLGGSKMRRMAERLELILLKIKPLLN